MSNKSYFDTISERFSCRSFTADKIKTEDLELILEAGRLAPTAVNRQPQRIYVIENPTLLEKLNEASRFIFNAKTVLCVCYDKTVSWHRGRDGKDHGEIDATICATQMMLAATALGLGSCYVCSFKEEILRQILGIPNEFGVSCLLPIGYPKDILPHNVRNEIEDLVIYK